MVFYFIFLIIYDLILKIKLYIIDGLFFIVCLLKKKNYLRDLNVVKFYCLYLCNKKKLYCLYGFLFI